MRNIDLSIIIVSYNTKDLLKDCLESIFKNSQSLKTEIIVVDNDSGDGSAEYLKKLKRKEVKTIFNQDNLGFSKANNQGIKKARGEFIFLLNSDTQIKKGSLQKLVAFAKEKKDLGVVGPCLLNKDGSVQASCFNLPTISSAIKQFWLGQKGAFEKYAAKEKREVEAEAVVGAAFLIPREVISKVGLLDERYFFYFEDMDYCRRVRKRGLRVYYLPQAKIIHLHGSSAQKKGKVVNQWLVKSSKIYHGYLRYYLITFILWSGQKWRKLRNCC